MIKLRSSITLRR